MSEAAALASSPHENQHAHQAGGGRLALLALAALGVIYGDIGTSPLYAIRECFYGPHAVGVDRANVLGVLSLVFWTLIILVTIKYHIYVLRADNRGEGGILALSSLIKSIPSLGRASAIMIPLGLFGAALLYGDGALTPAISVLSAVEGLGVATHIFDPFIIPITVLILVGLFAIQRHGTGRVGSMFGPVMLVWFSTLAVLGIGGIIRAPQVLAAVNPWHAATFFAHNGIPGFLVLGAVFLVATGGETLYADLGHFGHKPIQIDWFLLVGPALTLNYFGQGALLLGNPDAAVNPFYLLAPSWALYPMVVLATAATIIASQAVITGVFSLTMQATQLGYMPRVHIQHTSASQYGQIYIAGANWLLMLLTIGLVLGFRSSSALAGAYGVALTTTMAITTALAFPVAWKLWGWPLPVALAVTLGFLAVDLSFFAATIAKVPQGGWFALVLASVIYLLMTTWKHGRDRLSQLLQLRSMPLNLLLSDIAASRTPRVPGTAVFMTSRPGGTPVVLLHHLKHNAMLHEQVILLTIESAYRPHVPYEDSVRITSHGEGIFTMVGTYGFMEVPDVPELFRRARGMGLHAFGENMSYYLGRERLIITRSPGMAGWRKRLFAFMSRNAQPATEFFNLPPNRVVELGAQIEF